MQHEERDRAGLWRVTILDENRIQRGESRHGLEIRGEIGEQFVIEARSTDGFKKG